MSATKTLPTLRIDKSVILPDNSQWQNRFEIHSESSDRIYVISQNKAKRHWGCSCPAWRIHRKCKHLAAVNLPAFEQPYEVKILS
nr:SWIM zinc finger family protein [uncultured Flavobacterium sp.]